jgi:predicted small integral membrane protein
MELTFAWMAWTTPIAIFFACIFLMLAGMTVWELRSPTVERKGFLPMRTTRGDRLFIGLLTAAYINLAWVALTEISQWVAAGLGLLALIVIMAKA